MERDILRITGKVAVYTITVQPGEVVAGYGLNVSELLAPGETVTSVQSDTPATVPAAAGNGAMVNIKLVGPGNGVQVPVRLSVYGSLSSVRQVALLVVGQDPFVRLIPAAPNLFVRFRGNWQATELYFPQDQVLYGGLMYIALKGSKDTAPDISPLDWLALPGGGGGGGGGGAGLFPDAGGSGRSAVFRMKWVGPGDDDWQVEVKGVSQ